MIYPLVRELAAEKIPVAVTCRALGFSPQAYYKWCGTPVSQRCRQDSEMPKSRATWETEASPLRATAMTSRRNSAGNGLGTMLILPARPKPHRQGVN